MNIYNLFITNPEIFFPEIFFTISIIALIVYGSIVILNNNTILTIYTNKISLCIVGILLLLTINCYSFNFTYDFYNYNFILISKLIIIISIFCYLILTENSILQPFEFSLLILFSLLGFLLLVMSSDLILFYIAIEIQSISFYILSCLKRNSVFSTEAGLKYFILGALISGLFLFGCSLIYGSTGTLNFKDLSDLLFWNNQKVILVSTSTINKIIDNKYGVYGEINAELLLNSLYLLIDNSLLVFGSLCILFFIFFKLSVAPFHIWLPDIYEGSPTIVTAFFFILPKISLIISLVYIFNGIFSKFHNLIYWWEIVGSSCIILSIFIGSVTALQQNKLKRLLSYSSISHVGYILIGLFSNTIDGIQAVFFYLIIYVLTNICVWGSILNINKIKFISELKNLYQINYFLTCTLILSFFSLSGIPPLVGFLAKLHIFICALESDFYLIILFSIFLSVISTFYYLKLIKITLFEKHFYTNFNNLYFFSKKFTTFIISISFFSLFLLFIFPLFFNLITYYLSLCCFK